MKFRKRKDVRQRKSFKLNEGQTLLNSYWKISERTNLNSTIEPLKMSELPIFVDSLESMNTSSSSTPSLDTKLVLHGKFAPSKNTTAVEANSTNTNLVKHKYPFKVKTKTSRLKLGNKTTITKVHPRCVQTNRTRSVHRLFKISRHQVRRLAVRGNIPGSTKATW